MRKPVLIAGPTASGKSALALALAQRDAGMVINADALQVYSCWLVLSARPDDADLARAPHRLYGHVDAQQSYSVGAWLTDIRAALDAAAQRDLRPIIVGGTGLYFDALTSGLAEVPPVKPEVRRMSEGLLERNCLADMVEDLRIGDPVSHARMDLNNPMRVQRAWDVLRSSGRPLSAWQSEASPPVLAPECCERFVVRPSKAVLNTKIAARFHHMLDHGAIAECEAYLRAGYPLNLPSAKALGADEIWAYLKGETSRETAIERGIIATRQYAKRQRSWIRSRMADWTHLDTNASIEMISPQ